MRRWKPRICGACDGLWIEYGESGGGAAVASHGTRTDGGDWGAGASSRRVGRCLGGDPLSGASGGTATSVGRGGDAVDRGTRGVGAAIPDARVSGEDVGRVLMIHTPHDGRRSDARSPSTVHADRSSYRIDQPGAVTKRVPLMTHAAFVAWFEKQRNDIYVQAPYAAVPCRCGDVNCRGWRFVSVQASAPPASVDAVGQRLNEPHLPTRAKGSSSSSSSLSVGNS